MLTTHSNPIHQVQTANDFDMVVYGYGATLFAAAPVGTVAAIVFVDTHEYDGSYVDYHDVGGNMYAGNLKSDPFHNAFYVASEQAAVEAANECKDMTLVDAVGHVAALRAASFSIARRRAKKTPHADAV